MIDWYKNNQEIWLQILTLLANWSKYLDPISFHKTPILSPNPFIILCISDDAWAWRYPAWYFSTKIFLLSYKIPCFCSLNAEFKYDESKFVLFSLSHLFKYLLVIPLHNSIIVLEDRTFYFSYLKNGNMLSSIIFFSNLTLK